MNIVSRMLVITSALASISAGGDHTSQLTFEDRVRAQEAIERVYHSYRIGALPFDQAVPREVIERKVESVLRLSTALEEIWHTPVTSAALMRELRRIEADSRFPDRLLAMYDALGNDRVLILETFARSSLVPRLARAFFTGDSRLRTAADGTPLSFDQWWDASWLRFAAAGSAFAHDLSGLPRLPANRTGPRTGKDPVEAFLPGGDPQENCAVVDVWSWGRGFGPPPERIDFTSVWTGSEMIVWGGDTLNVGSSGGRYDPLTDFWSLTSVQGAPSQRSGHTAVWTGSEMIVWGGGGGGTPSNTGGRYDPISDTWHPTSLTNAPSTRRDHTAVWTGDEMIVWGGWPSTNTGGRYDPVADSWTPTSLVGAPEARQEHLAVWTGDEMIIWGGFFLTTGGRYHPESDTWTPTSNIGTPGARLAQTAVWTGHEMVVWGGFGGGVLPEGGRYDPVTDTWEPTSLVGAPENRYGHTAVWTGNRMIVWGGFSFAQAGPTSALNTGGNYDPEADTWTSTSLLGAPAPRSLHGAVWSGDRMIVWGGAGITGGRYDPGTDTWTPTSTTSPVPSPRSGHTAAWTGAEMIIWGGGPGTAPTGARWDALTGNWMAVSTIGSPPARRKHTAIWTGEEMIIWGGMLEGSPGIELADGGRYDPISDVWKPTSSSGSPSARSGHSAVWTGSEMIIWGGDASRYVGGELSDGARYDPTHDAWTSMSSANTPSARAWHSAVWTGSEMIVSGGSSAGTPGRYDPIADSWRPTSSVGAPTALDSSSIWTGHEVIVWGGDIGTNQGRRYDPVADTWKPTSTAGAPPGRVFHGAVYTGDEMIVWGGMSVLGYSIKTHATGGLYDPGTDTWRATSLIDAPQGRFGHTMIWTGAAMIPWGGTYYSGDIHTYVTEGQVSWYGGGPLPPPDDDGDGYSSCDGDCDDADPATHPGAVDLPGDSRDQDCSEGPMCDPAAPWRTRGKYVSCVARECNRLVAEARMSVEECSRIISAAARGPYLRVPRR